MQKILLVDLLGLELTSPEIETLLSVTNIKQSKVKFGHDKFTAHGVNEKLEINLQFQKDFVVLENLNDCDNELSASSLAKIRKMNSFPEGTLFLSSLMISSNHLFEHGYMLPFEASINKTSVEDLSALLGAPCIASKLFKSMCWRIDKQLYRFIYDADSKKIISMSIPLVG